MLRPPPQTQALSSRTFRVPPLDGSLALPELYDWHAEHSPEHPVFKFAREDGITKTIYWPEVAHAVRVGAKLITQRTHSEVERDERPIVAILSHSDTIPYFVTAVSVMRAHCVVFPISPRNSPTAVAHLIQKVGVKHILVGQEQSMRDLSSAALNILESQYPSTPKPNLTPMPLYEDLFLSPTDPSVTLDDAPYINRGSETLCLILHSSGSTAFPKPIFWTQGRFAEMALIPWFGERDLTGVVWSLHTMPMYHGMGVLQLYWAPSCGLIVSAFEPKTPAPMPTPDGLFKAAKATDSDVIFCVPSIIEAWAQRPEYVKWLASRTGVLFGGGPLNKEAGDYMTSQGVSIFILYGSTEGGIMSPILPDKVGYDWEYFRIPDNVKSHMVPYGNNTYEFVMVLNHFCTLSVINTQVDGVPAYATSDLFAPHPTKPGYWKIFGRTDDQIMHNTGEKTNPGPLESMLNQDPHVLSSVMFGRGRFQAGILVDPKSEYRFDPSDEVKLAEFRNKIWPTVERMNAYAPQHSRLFKEMIIVAKPSKPFTYTAKSTARRQAVIADYEDEINAVYDKVEESTQSNIPPPAQWDVVSTTDFVRAVVNKVLRQTVNDDDDLFEHGCDSLQATWIRNSLLRALHDSVETDTRRIADNLVYDNPSVLRLASFISDLACGKDGTETSQAGRVDAMRAMLARYNKHFPLHRADDHNGHTAGDVVLVTGTTGSLGCHILARLANRHSVSRIFALNRTSRDKTPLRTRQEQALLQRGLSASILEDEKVVLLEGDLTAARLGLPEETYEKLRQVVTHIVHNAWRVDFNLSLSSFESNIKGLRSLIDLSLTTRQHKPARLIFLSSIGVYQNVQRNEVQSEALIEPDVAVSSGYTESKWVSEAMLLAAGEEAQLNALIVRVGQICGGADGAWNVNEWFPSMVQSSKKLGVFPIDDGVVSWIQPEVAANAIVDYIKGPATVRVVNLVHPRPCSWNILADAISVSLNIKLVSYQDWLSLLATQSQHMAKGKREEHELLRELRALKLLPFFQRLVPGSAASEAMGFPSLATTEAVAASPTLSDPSLRQLTPEDVHRWIARWKKAGLW